MHINSYFFHDFMILRIPGNKHFISMFLFSLHLRYIAFNTCNILKQKWCVTLQFLNVTLFWTENDLDDLEKALNLLSAPDLKSFAKTYHLTSTANKKEIIPSLLKKCTGNTIGSMFKVSGHDPRQTMLKRLVKFK